MTHHEHIVLRDRALEHVGLLVSGLIAFVVVYRLLAIAQWDTQTAAAILQYSGSANVILGVAVSAAPMIVTTTLWLIGGALFYRWARDTVWPGFLWYGWLTLVTALFGLTIANSAQLFFMLLIWGGAALIGRLDRKADPELARRQNQRIVLSVFASLLISTVVTTESSWLPREAINPRDGNPFSAYVLKSDSRDEWIVLRDSPREVEFIVPGSEGGRKLCAESGGWPGNWFWQRPLDLLGGSKPARYPACP